MVIYGVCVRTCVCKHSRCIGLLCSFICVIGDRVNCLGGVCTVCVCVGCRCPCMIGVCSIVVSVGVFGVKDFDSDSTNGMLELLSPSVYPSLLLWSTADPTFRVCTVGIHIGGWYGLPVVGIVVVGSINVSLLLSLLSSLPPSLHSSLLILNNIVFAYDRDGRIQIVRAPHV